MARKYADRAFVNVNGAPYTPIQKGTVRRNFNARPVRGMTKDGNNPGYVQGNIDITLNMVKAIENQRAREKIEAIDFENNDVSVTFICGADQYILRGLFPMDMEDDAPGVGEEAKNTANFGALQLTDAVGNPVDFAISF